MDVEYQFITGDKISTSFPYIVVVSQDCDLEQDAAARVATPKKHDTYLDTILICPAFIAETFRAGQHMAELGMEMEPKGKAKGTTWNYIHSNRDPRYHLLDAGDSDGMPELVVDFKRYYTIPRSHMYENYDDHFKTSVNELYRELLSQRFASFLSRVGLPTEDSIA
ncbi:MAG TPA: hypothetical protein VK502_01450 [Candidatus Saccharimonadales bacterium]|nr:hypothetical protein [Candidatus Saccharimonadales bacterium]